MSGIIESRDRRGAERTIIEASSPLFDLQDGVVSRTEADGTVTLRYTLLSFTLEELIDHILLSAKSYFFKGLITNASKNVEAFTFDFDSPLSALQELAALCNLEMAIRRQGLPDQGYAIDFFEERGIGLGVVDVKPYVDATMDSGSPTTNFGSSVLLKHAVSPTTPKNFVIQFDLSEFAGLTVTAARLIFYNTGGGSGTSHVIGFRPLRRNTIEDEVTWDDASAAEAWTAGGAEDNPDRCLSPAWGTTVADNTDSSEVVIFTGSADTGLLLKDFVQEIIDRAWTSCSPAAPVAVLTDGKLRLVIQGIVGGQAGKECMFHSRESATVAKRPVLELTFADYDVPRWLFAKNIIGISRESDPAELVNRYVPAGGTQGPFRLSVGRARWEVDTVPSGTTFTVLDDPLFEDDHLVGNYVERLSDGALFEISDSDVALQEITTTAAHGLSPGDFIAFRENAAGDQLVHVESPSSVAEFGLVERVLDEDDLPPVDNLVSNPAFRDFTGGLADDWNTEGPAGATFAQDTDPVHTTIGNSAQKVTTTQEAQGIRSDPIAIDPSEPEIFFAASVWVFVESGGGIEFYLDHSTEGRFPIEGSEESAFTTELGKAVKITIAGKEFPAGTVEIVIVSREAGATVFYVDAAQFTNTAAEFEFFEGRAPVILWQRALEALDTKRFPRVTYQLPAALDLTTVDPIEFPYDEARIGGGIVVQDERLEIDTETRILELTRDLKAGRTISFTLSNKPQDLVDQLVKLRRRSRIIDEERPPAPRIQYFEASLTEAGEIALYVVVGTRTLSWRYLVDKTGSPVTYADVLATGVVSNEIEGGQVLTNVALESNQEAAIRVVAFALKSGLGTPGETKARTITLPPVTGSLSRVRARLSAALTFGSGGVAFTEWDVEDFDIGNWHTVTGGSKRKDFFIPHATGSVILFVGQSQWNVGAVAGRKQTTWLKSGTSLTTPYISYVKAGAFIGLAGYLEFFPGQGMRYEMRHRQVTGVSLDLEPPDSLFGGLRIPVTSDQPRANLQRPSGVLSINDSTDTVLSDWAEQLDIGGLFSAGDPERITIPTAGGGRPYLFVGQHVWEGAATGLRAARMRKNGTTVVAREEEFDPGAPVGAIDEFAEGFIYLELDATAADYYEHVVRQESGGGLNLTSSQTARGSIFQALELIGAANPRAHVNLTSNVSVVDSTDTVISWDAQQKDVGNLWDGGDPTKFDIGAQGVYLALVQIPWASNTVGLREVWIRKNGDDDDIIAHKLIGDADGAVTFQAWGFDSAVVGDYYEVLVRQESGGNLNVIASPITDCYFKIIRIGDS